jgi:tRNA(His) guanylyltransferase
MDKTDLGDRMKQYEAQETERKFLPMLPIYARIDGRCFSTFTRGMERPYDIKLSHLMINVTKALIKETNALIGYTQSDEISLCWYNDDYKSELFFNGKIFKITSALSAIASVHFLKGAMELWPEKCQRNLPTFDARAIQLPNVDECANMFLWREIDATKNAISMAARSFYSHKKLFKKNSSRMQEMLFEKGVNFNDYPPFFKRGTFVRKINVSKKLSKEELDVIPEDKRPIGPVIRSEVHPICMPPFSKVVNRVDVIFNKENPVTETK